MSDQATKQQTDSLTDFDFDLATMALKGRRFGEAEERFIALASKYNKQEAWCGLGIAKLGLILDQVTVDEVFYCFSKAKLSPNAEKKDIDKMVFQATGEVTRKLYELGARATLSLQKADKAGKIALISTVVMGVFTLGSQTEGRALNTLVNAGFTALSYRDYLKAGATAADCKALIEKLKVVITELRASLIAFVEDDALTEEFNKLTEDCRLEYEKAIRPAAQKQVDDRRAYVASKSNELADSSHPFHQLKAEALRLASSKKNSKETMKAIQSALLENREDAELLAAKKKVAKRMIIKEALIAWPICAVLSLMMLKTSGENPLGFFFIAAGIIWFRHWRRTKLEKAPAIGL